MSRDKHSRRICILRRKYRDLEYSRRAQIEPKSDLESSWRLLAPLGRFVDTLRLGRLLEPAGMLLTASWERLGGFWAARVPPRAIFEGHPAHPALPRIETEKWVPLFHIFGSSFTESPGTARSDRSTWWLQPLGRRVREEWEGLFVFIRHVSALGGLRAARDGSKRRL